jgi:rare lipoprotein A
MVSAPMISRSVLTLVIVAGPLSGLPSEAVAADIGMASFYGKDHVGRKTASGRRFDSAALTAAHRTLPFGTMITVTNLKNGRSVVVEVADRGPFRRGRILDVSYAAADRLGFVREGLAKIRIDKY